MILHEIDIDSALLEITVTNHEVKPQARNFFWLNINPTNSLPQNHNHNHNDKPPHMYVHTQGEKHIMGEKGARTVCLRWFFSSGPKDQRREYHKRPHIEAVYSYLKTQYSLTVKKVRGLGNVASYALFSILCLVLNREAAENIGRYYKAISPAYFNT